MKQKKSFTLYWDYWEWLRLLPDEELGHLFRAIYIYEREGVMPQNLSAEAALAFTVIKGKLDTDRSAYDKLCVQNKQKARLRWQKDSISR